MKVTESHYETQFGTAPHYVEMSMTDRKQIRIVDLFHVEWES